MKKTLLKLIASILVAVFVGVAIVPSSSALAAANINLSNGVIIDCSNSYQPSCGNQGLDGEALVGALGYTAGIIGDIAAIAGAGSVTGLSGAGITSGLAAIGSVVGGGMIAGVVVTAALPVGVAVGVGALAHLAMKNHHQSGSTKT